MYIPTWISKGLKTILFNLDANQKRESAITNDLGEYFASGPMVEKLIESERKATKPHKIVRKRWFADDEEHFLPEMAA